MKLYAVRIFVDDFNTACDFYGNTLGLPSRNRNDEIGWAEFDVGGASLGIEQAAPGEEESADLVGRFVGVSLQVNDIDAVYERLVEKGVRFTGPPVKQPWGGTLAHFDDPAGNTLTLLG